MALWQLLKQPARFFTIIGIAFILFDISYIVMSKLPGTKNGACAIGASLTTTNLAFSAISSLLIAILLVGFFTIYSSQKSFKKTHSATGISVLALISGQLTLFCSVCSLPILATLGLGGASHFINLHSIWFQIISLGLLSIGLVMLNRQLKHGCKI